MMHQVIDTYEKWCSRLSTARLNRWLCKVSLAIISLVLSSLQLCKFKFYLSLSVLEKSLCFFVGHEQAFLERSGCTTQDQVLHPGEGSAPNVRRLYGGENKAVEYRSEVLNKIFEGRLRFGGHSNPNHAAVSSKEKRRHWQFEKQFIRRKNR